MIPHDKTNATWHYDRDYCFVECACSDSCVLAMFEAALHTRYLQDRNGAELGSNNICMYRRRLANRSRSRRNGSASVRRTGHQLLIYLARNLSRAR